MFVLLAEPSMRNAAQLDRSKTRLQGKNYGTAKAGPVGTGPFKFTSWNQGSNITISRNDAYWDTAHAPKTKSVVFSFIPEESTMTTGLLSGEIDGAYHTPYSGLTQLRSSSVGTLYLGKSMLFTVIYISTTSGPLANINVRKALLKAIDRQALAKAVYSGAATPLPSTMSGATPSPRRKPPTRSSRPRCSTSRARRSSCRASTRAERS